MPQALAVQLAELFPETRRRYEACEEQDERERRDRQIGVMRALVRELVEEHRQAVVEGNEADMSRVRERAAGQRIAEQHEVRTRMRRLVEKLGH